MPGLAGIWVIRVQVAQARGREREARSRRSLSYARSRLLFTTVEVMVMPLRVEQLDQLLALIDTVTAYRKAVAGGNDDASDRFRDAVVSQSPLVARVVEDADLAVLLDALVAMDPYRAAPEEIDQACHNVLIRTMLLRTQDWSGAQE